MASGLADGPMPSDAADRQMLATDAARVAERHDEVCALLEAADKLLAEHQPAASRAAKERAASGPTGGGGSHEEGGGFLPAEVRRGSPRRVLSTMPPSRRLL